MHLSPASDLPSGVVGGLLIGASSTCLMLALGKLSAMSEVASWVTRFQFTRDGAWKWSFFSGLVASGGILAAVLPAAFGLPTDMARQISPAALFASAALMGYASRYGYGCTSGHGVCGLPRLSPRSLTAVGTFMTTAAVTAFVVRNVAPVRAVVFSGAAPSVGPLPLLAALLASALLFTRPGLAAAWRWVGRWLGVSSAPTVAVASKHPAAGAAAPAASLLHEVTVHAVSLACGLTFGLALGYAGMTNPERVAQFLDFSSAERGWDPTLAGVMGGAVLVNLISFG